MHADWPAIQGIGKAKNCTQADTHTRQVRPPREHAGPWPERACLTRPNSPGSRDPTTTGSHRGHHARTPGETHLLSCAAAHDQHDGEAELKRILRDLGPHRGEALRDRARLPNRHPGSSVRVSREMSGESTFWLMFTSVSLVSDLWVFCSRGLFRVILAQSLWDRASVQLSTWTEFDFWCTKSVLLAWLPVILNSVVPNWFGTARG